MWREINLLSLGLIIFHFFGEGGLLSIYYLCRSYWITIAGNRKSPRKTFIKTPLYTCEVYCVIFVMFTSRFLVIENFQLHTDIFRENVLVVTHGKLATLRSHNEDIPAEDVCMQMKDLGQQILRRILTVIHLHVREWNNTKRLWCEIVTFKGPCLRLKKLFDCTIFRKTKFFLFFRRKSSLRTRTYLLASRQTKMKDQRARNSSYSEENFSRIA